MDTWATSSMTPQIVGQWLTDPALYQQVFPFALRPQAHEIIRTWAFDTIVKSLYMFGTLPWREVAISGWGLAPAGRGQDQQESWRRADGTGGDDRQILRRCGALLGGEHGLWQRYDHQRGAHPGGRETRDQTLECRAAQRARAGGLCATRDATSVRACGPLAAVAAAAAGRARDRRSSSSTTTPAAKAEIEGFFWATLADNYLELAKMRLYDATDPQARGRALCPAHDAADRARSCSRRSCPTSPRRSTRRSSPTRAARFTVQPGQRRRRCQRTRRPMMRA